MQRSPLHLLVISFFTKDSIPFFNSVKQFQVCLHNFQSQFPQTGQFNSYIVCIMRLHQARNLSLNPLKRVNSILTPTNLNPGKLHNRCRSQSPQTGQFNSYLVTEFLRKNFPFTGSQSPQTGQFNSYIHNRNNF